MNISATLTGEQTAAYLRTLPAVRERCSRVFELAKAGKLQYFDYHPEKEAEVTEYCVSIMKVSKMRQHTYRLAYRCLARLWKRLPLR